jgi:hypothetical protein
MAYQTHWEDGGIYQKFSGVVTTQEFLQSVADIQNRENFDDLNFVLVDLLSVDHIDVGRSTAADVHISNIGAATTNPDILVAVVTSSSKIEALALIGASSEFASYPMGVFHSVADAKTWLSAKLAGRGIEIIVRK